MALPDSRSAAPAIKAAQSIASALRDLRAEGVNELADEIERRSVATIGDILTLGELTGRLQAVVVWMNSEGHALGDPDTVDSVLAHAPPEMAEEVCMLAENILAVSGGSTARISRLAGRDVARLLRAVMQTDSWRGYLSDDTRRQPMIGMLKNLALARAMEVLSRPAGSEDEREAQERMARFVLAVYVPPTKGAAPQLKETAEDWLRGQKKKKKKKGRKK